MNKERWLGGTEVHWCHEPVLCGGATFTPDDTRAYIECRLSHAWPVVTYWRNALHPQTVANSYASMIHQKVDLSHLVKSYDPENITRDRIIGCVVAVEFPPAPAGGWRLAKEVDQAPGVRAVMSVFKQAEGVDRLLGQHQSGRHTWTVSMELSHDRRTGAFVLPAGSWDEAEDRDTPAEFREQGLQLVPFEKAGEKLLACLPRRSGQAVKALNVRGREVPVVYLMGGVGGQVHYEGIGVVQHGAEAQAAIDRVMAGSWGALPGPLRPVEQFLSTARHLLHVTQKALATRVAHGGT